MFEWLLLFHVLFAMIWFGGSVYLEGLMAAAGRTGEATAVTTAFRAVAPTNRRLFSIAGIGSIVFGFWLVAEIGAEFESLWIAIAIVASLLAIGLDLFYAAPRGSKVVDLVTANGADDVEAAALAAKVSIAGHVRTVLLAIAFVMMIFQPGG